ncbi:glutamyl endopeptidase [Marininema mesophilum]|uniref:Serine protease n=1 Tax=Marininema mesophilum TaxID=1048340 RepID=A0A1H2T736_9BACL|nr:serine protease [Marininema mesophilum]SDW39577.1 glutamyl endopeptidase [Marininema mesophilum]
MINCKKGLRILLLSLVVIVSLSLSLIGSSNAKAATTSKSELSPYTMISNDGTITPPTKPSNKTFSKQRDGATTPSYKGTNAQKATVKNGLPSIGAKSIIGRDDRERVTSTTSYPYSAIAQISTDLGDCTGWFINANTVVTAGHCVYNTDINKWANWSTVTPGRDGNNAPYGTYNSNSFHSVSGWINNEDTNYNYAVIKLNSDIGNRVGYFGLRFQSGPLMGAEETISGYPGDKPYGTQWRQNDRISQVDDKKLYYTNDTHAQSGSPVFLRDNYSIGIHTDGGNSYNSGIRINEDVFNNLVYWENQ